MTRRGWAGIIIGVVSVVFATTEILWAADGDSDTVPITGYLVRLPWWLLMPVAVGFGVWLPWHLWDAKRRRDRQEK